MWTVTIPATPGSSSGFTVSGPRANVSGSMSAKRGTPPACTTAAAVAKKVLEGTMTFFPSTPMVRKRISSALVPLLTAMA
jgi:hypothetical protein